MIYLCPMSLYDYTCRVEKSCKELRVIWKSIKTPQKVRRRLMKGKIKKVAKKYEINESILNRVFYGDY